MRHIRTDELVAANFTVREALFASVIAEIYTLVEKAEKARRRSFPANVIDFFRSRSRPDSSISDTVATAILNLATPVLDTTLGRKQHRPGDVSRIKLIGALAAMNVPVMPMYPSEEDIDNTQAYCDAVEAATERHLTDVRSDLPIPGEFEASRNWALDRVEFYDDTRGEQQREFRRSAAE